MSKLSDIDLIEELQKRFSNNQHTIQELKELTAELKSVNKKLEESEALKSHFISNITNEIINPFTSILGLSRSILSVKKEDWKRVISMVALIHSEAFQLDFQLRNIFVAAKIEAGEIYPEIINVEIETLIKTVIESFKLEAKKKNIELILEFNIESEKQPFNFKTDPEKLKIALANLLSNAVKYSFDNSNVHISVSKTSENVLVMSIQDFGAGISEENQKIIFDRFKRVDSGINSVNRGHGLGLSINKAVTDLLQGKLEVKSDVNAGSIFTLYIPEAQSNTTDFSADGNEFMFDNEEVF